MTPTDRPLVDEDAVAEFLANNNDFFARRPELLPDLETPSANGDVVSLADRQAAALRERNAGLQSRLDALIANARHSERTFTRLQALILALLDAADAAALDGVLADRLVRDFELDHAVCFVRGWSPMRPLMHLAGVAGETPWPRLFDRAKPSGEVCRAEQYRALFPAANVDSPASVALLPLSETAVLALGCKDPQRFSPDAGDVFLSFLADVLTRTLTRLRIG